MCGSGLRHRIRMARTRCVGGVPRLRARPRPCDARARQVDVDADAPAGARALVNAVVDPAAALLHAESTPLALREQLAFGHLLRHVLWEDHVPARPRGMRHAHARRRASARREPKPRRAEAQGRGAARSVRPSFHRTRAGTRARTCTQSRRRNTCPNTQCRAPSPARADKSRASATQSGCGVSGVARAATRRRVARARAGAPGRRAPRHRASNHPRAPPCVNAAS